MIAIKRENLKRNIANFEANTISDRNGKRLCFVGRAMDDEETSLFGEKNQAVLAAA